jgi:hypothetical protein
MELNEATVVEIADRVQGFAAAWGQERAEACVAQQIATLQRKWAESGLGEAPPEAIEKLDTDTRQRWDTDAYTAGSALALLREVTQQQIEDRIAEASVLPPTVEPLLSQQARQNEEMIALWAMRELRELAATKTRTEALDWYQAADESQQEGRRVVTFLEASWRTTAFQADPEHDAIAVMRLQAAIESRRLTRVPAKWLAMRETLARAGWATFPETVAHLRAGRGIAKRPVRPTMTLA